MRTVFITGISSGIGYETALLFSRLGWNTYGTVKDLGSERSKQLDTIKNKENLPLNILEADITSDEQISSAIKEILKQENNIDVLINNAGFGFLGPVETFTIEEIKTQYEVNIFGALRTIKYVLPNMRENKKGKIINISSVNGLLSFPLYGVYSSSKFALETISEVLRYELKPFNIKVSIVEPGAFKTNFSKNVRVPAGVDSSVYSAWAKRMFDRLINKDNLISPILGRLADPKRVAKLLFQIATSDNPRLRYKIGLDTHLYTLLRKIVPYELWSAIINSVYKWY